MLCMNHLSRLIRVKSLPLRIAFGEFLGTCILIVFGCGSVAQSVLSKEAKGQALSVNIAWGLAVMCGVFSCINVSGGHLNPALSLAMAVIGRLKWRLLPVYCIAQYVGAFTGAAVVYLVYFEAIVAYDGGVRTTDPLNKTATAGIFSTYPQPYLSTAMGFVDQVVGTCMLVLMVMAVTDKRNSNLPVYLVAPIAGLIVLVIGTSYGFNCGYAINPARDLGPRMFTAVAGWGSSVFSYRDYNWFWVPIAGPHVGALLGAVLYLLIIESHWEEKSDSYASSQQTIIQMRKRDEDVQM